MKKFVAVVPIVSEKMTREERISLEVFFKIRFPFDCVALCPEGIKPGGLFSYHLTFPKNNFCSRESYSRLLLTEEFYKLFVAYEFILIHQLDCLVMSSDSVAFWEGKFDYIGAPWFKSASYPDEGFLGVGNGGLSLRKVEAAIRVLRSRNVPSYSHTLMATRWMPELSLFGLPKRTAKALRIITSARRGVAWYTSHYTLNEDKFWGLRARLFDPSFRIAPVERALEFSFECFPRYCYELNGRRLPFGCHAWAKHDRAFWEQFIDLQGLS